MKRICGIIAFGCEQRPQAHLPPSQVSSSSTESRSSNEKRTRRRRKPVSMGYRHVPSGGDISVQSFESDPLHTYMRETPDYKGTWVQKASANVRFRLNWSHFVHRGRAWTIGEKACIGYSEPYKEKHQSRIDRMISNAISRLIRLQAKFLTKEQIKRRLEVMVKLNSAIEETLGIRKEEMVCLEIIVTSPKKQGRGYGSALGKIVTAVADAEKRDSWLVSCNVAANTGFYNSLGFVTCATFVVGEDNPSYKGSPVIIAIMIREYSPSSDTNEKVDV